MAETWSLTGASGYIGRRLSEQLIADGATVRGLSRSGVAGGVDEIRGDLADGNALQSLVSGADVIVHLAAYVHRPAVTEAQKLECRRINVDGTAAVIRAILHAAPQAFLIFVSSSSVYSPSESVLTESSECEPPSVYGQTKLEAEQLVLNEKRLNAVVLRPAMVFGPGAPGNLQRLMAMVSRGLVVELGNRSPRKSVVAIENLIAAIRVVAESRTVVSGETFNVSGGDPLEMRQIASALSCGLGVSPRFVRVPLSLARAGAAVAGPILRAARPSSPSLRQMVETYGASSVLSEEKLKVMTAYRPVVQPAHALERLARSIAR